MGETPTVDEVRRLVLDCDEGCHDLYEHDLFTSGRAFRWCWPKVNVYVPADKHRRTMWNRYPHNTIGAAIVLLGRCWGVQWKRSGSGVGHRDEAGEP